MSNEFHGNRAGPINAPELPANGGVKVTSHPAATDWRSPAPSTHPALTGTSAGSGAMATLGATPKRIG
jgi:hypothetical protein